MLLPQSLLLLLLLIPSCNEGSIHLGFLAMAFFNGYLLKENFTENGGSLALDFLDVILILFSVGLFFITIRLNRDSKINHKKDLEPLMNSYREEVIKRNLALAEEQASSVKDDTKKTL